MWRRFRSPWDHFGRANAFGAILTGSDGSLAAWDADAFFAAGRADAERFVARLTSLAPSVPRTDVLDFGCGVGRVTRALGDHFQRVVGVDVARSMIDRARSRNQNPRCSYVVNEAPHLRCFRDAEFPVVYSRLVLQHIRPGLVRRYIPELVRVLAPGGVLMFQLPDVIGAGASSPLAQGNILARLKRRLPWPVVVLWRELKYRSFAGIRTPQMQMYGMAPDEVLSLVRGAGGRLLDVSPDSSHGGGAAGFEYWVSR